MKSLGICVMVKNEAAYIAEWLEFCRLVGVSRFVIYDDDSTDETREVIRSRDRGDIVLHTFSDGWYSPEYDGVINPMQWHTSHQCRAFVHYTRHHVQDTFWSAYIDPDEFLFHADIDSLPQALEAYEDKYGLVVNWSVFGSNGHATKPAGLVIENYTRRARSGEPEPWGRHVKPVVTNKVPYQWGIQGSHCPLLPPGCAPISQAGNVSPWSMTFGKVEGPFRLHHYYHKSAEEAAHKLVKGYNNFPGYPGTERLAVHDRNEVEDTTILRFVPALRKALQCG